MLVFWRGQKYDRLLPRPDDARRAAFAMTDRTEQGLLSIIRKCRIWCFSAANCVYSLELTQLVLRLSTKILLEKLSNRQIQSDTQQPSCPRPRLQRSFALCEIAMIDLPAFVKGFPDPVIVVGSDFNIHLFNRAAVDLFEQVEQGLSLSQLVRNSDLLEAIERVFDKGKKESLSFRLKKRYKHTINATLIPLAKKGEGQSADGKGADGKGTSIACEASGLLFIHLRDMSEPERLAKMRMHFIANASHELRTPLASLMGFVETLQTTAREDEKARDRFLKIMAEQTRRMTRLINDLLSLSQLEMNTDAPPDILVDIVETLSGVVELLAPLAQTSEVILVTDLPDGPRYVCGEKDELVQVFQNIIQNAIRYGGDGGKVWIAMETLAATQKHGPRLSISIRDNGRGIAAKHIPRLTQRFYRVDKVISRNKGGTGLGLAITKHIIIRHGGKLDIKSKAGKGAVFTVLLPECQKSCEIKI